MQEKVEKSQQWNASIDISSIHSDSYSHSFDVQLCRPYWNMYLSSLPPNTLNLNQPLHKLIWLFHQASSQKYFSQLYYYQVDSHFHTVSLSYHRVRQVLAKQKDELSKIIWEVVEGISVQPLNFLTALALTLHLFLKVQNKLFLMMEDFPMIEMVEIKAHMVERFVSFKCVVLKVQQIKLMATSMDFQCCECKSSFKHFLIQGMFSNPTKCRGDKRKQCQGKTFTALKETIQSIFIQRVKVQETDSQGRVPRQIACQFRENLVGKVIAGETVTLSGVLKTEPSEERDHKSQGIFTPFLIVNSIKQKANPTEKYNMDLIHKMRNNKKIFFSFIKSFCPTIYGHQIVKAGLILGLIGGSSHSLAEQSTFRETSHVLLLGDPGLGKSQLLKFAAELLPHSVYVNATSVSSSGMTVTVNKDNNQQTLEAGALILADGGICAIDEFDKINDASCLLEVMEQQTVSIAKAGIICQLKCRVGIFASGNPVQGSYKKQKSFKDNTRISNAILSRFDLIFLLLDKPDADRDRKLSEHIMKIHNHNRKKSATNPIPNRIYSQYLSLADQYSHQVEQQSQSYSLEDMKHYLVYVRTQIHPILSMEAAEVLKGFYISLRENNPTNSFQITSRQLQSLIRLSMARARIQCRTQVTQMDAIEITNLMQQSLFDSFEEMGYNINSLNQEVKKVKVTAKSNGELSLPKQRKVFLEELNQLSKQRSQILWDWSELVKVAKDLQLNVGDFHIFIERLNQEGILLQKGPKKYSYENNFL